MVEEIMTVKELTMLCHTIQEMMCCNQLKELEDFLRNLDYSQSLDYLLGTIRYSSPFRNHLEEWPIARDKLYTEIVKRGEDADSMMEGLFGDDKGRSLEAFYAIENLRRNQKK